MQQLDFSNCHRTKTNMDIGYLRELINLNRLNLYGCFEMTDNGLEQLGLLTNLTSLILDGCDEITDTGLEHLLSLVNLTTLNLKCCWEITTDTG